MKSSTTSNKFPSKKICLIGAGKLGEVLLASWLDHKLIKKSELHVHLRSKKSAAKIRSRYKITTSAEESGAELPPAQIYILAVRPGEWKNISETVKTKISAKGFLLSIMAGIPPSRIEEATGKPTIVAMTNTGAQVQAALTSLFYSASVSPAQKRIAKKLFAPIGSVYEIPEKNFSDATAFGGSQPAFILWTLQTLSDLLSEKFQTSSLDWTRQIVESALKLSAKKSPAEAIKQIATPGGCTQVGLDILEQSTIKNELRKVFEECSKKAAQLGN